MSISLSNFRLPAFPYRWRIVAFLFVLAVINNLDRQTLSVLAPTLRAELDFSAVHYSYVVTAFLFAYALGYCFCGTIIDRFGVKLAIAGALSAWSLAGMAHGFATGWVALAVCRFALGLGESFAAPAAIKAIAEWTPRRERGLSTAIFSNGNIFGAIIAPPLVAFIALKFGWQYGFLVTGAIGFLYLAFWWRSYDTPERHRRLPAEERAYIISERGAATAQPRLSFVAAFRHPAVIGFFVARFLTDSLSFFFSFWLPDYLQSARGLSLAMIGFVAWIPFLAADVGGPGGGALSDWLVRRGWAPRAARRRMMLVAACLMPLSVLAVHVSSVALAIALIGVLLAAQSCWLANLMTLMSETFPREQIATFFAIAGIGGSVGGILSTLLAGRVIDAVGYVPVFTVLGFLHLAAYQAIFRGLRREQK